MIRVSAVQDEKMLNWFDLPSIVQSYVEKRIREAGK